MGIMVLALGFAVLFNFVILRIKWNRGNYADVGVDIVMLALLNAIFGGSILGVISATAGSTLISLYLIWFPIKLFNSKKLEGKNFQEKSQEICNTVAERFDKLFE